MTFWQRTPVEVDARLGEIADLLLECRSAFFEICDRYHWDPAAGSGAAAAAQQLPSPDPRIARPNSETGHRLIAEVLQTYLLTASYHLGALAALYARGEVFFSPPALIRATIENCAHAVWVVGDDPDEPAENRLARAYLEEHLSALEAKNNAGRMHEANAPAVELATRRYEALKELIPVRFVDHEREKGTGNWILNGQKLLGPEKTVRWMYGLTETYGGTIDSRTAQGIYGVLSNKTHPTLYPARQIRDWTHDPVAGHSVAYLRINPVSVEREARAALAAFYNALTYVSSYFGWPTEVHDDLTQTIETTIPTFFL